jgi:hypothetical protein
MIVNERMTAYINSLDMGNTPLLDEIEREALDTYVPIVRREMQSFLKVLLAMKKTHADPGGRDGRWIFYAAFL